MVTEHFYKSGSRVIAHAVGLANNADFDVSTADWSVGNVDAETYIVGGACDVKLLVDSDGDFAAPDTTITLDSFGGNGISEGNATPLADHTTTLRITNTSGGAADFVVVGRANGQGGE